MRLYRTNKICVNIKGLNENEKTTKTLRSDNCCEKEDCTFIIKYRTEFKFKKARPGRPIVVTTSETIEKIHDFLINDRRVRVREIAETVGISIERVQNILKTHLDMKKLSTRWARFLTTDNKHTRANFNTKFE